MVQPNSFEALNPQPLRPSSVVDGHRGFCDVGGEHDLTNKFLRPGILVTRLVLGLGSIGFRVQR